MVRIKSEVRPGVTTLKVISHLPGNRTKPRPGAQERSASIPENQGPIYIFRWCWI